MNERTHVPARSGPIRLLFVAALAILATTLLSPGTALAVNSVVSSSPEDGSTITESPTEIQITFTEELGEQNSLSVTCNAELFTVGPLNVGDGQRSLSAEVIDPLPKGTCVARWAVDNPDGEANGEGNITFTVENDSAAASSTTQPEAGDGTSTSTEDSVTDGSTEATDAATGTDEATEQIADLSDVESGEGPLWLGRLLSVFGLAVLFGSLVVIATAWPEGVEYLITVRFIRTAWIVALIGTLLYVAAASSAATGSGLGAGLNPGNWLDLFDAGAPGVATIARLVLVAATGYVAFQPDRIIDPVTQMASLGVPALAVATIGMSRTDMDLAIVAVPLSMVHALAMSIWLGGVVLLTRVVLAGPGEEDLVHAVRGFSRLSNLAIGATVATGIIQMVILDGGDLFGSSHGRVVLLKTVVVAGMIFVAVSARQFVGQRLARADELTIPMADRLRRAFGIEAATGLVVLALSSWLVALDPPNIDSGTTIAYAIERQFEVPDADLDVTVRLTTNRVGTAGLEIDVDAPDEGLTELEIVLTAPPNDTIGGISVPGRLTGAGVAVLPAASGIPLDVAGDWTMVVNAVTAAGAVNSNPQAFTILNADGTAAAASGAAVPSLVIVTVPE